MLSLIVPALDEVGTLPGLLADLQPLRREGAELILCDGGSSDGTTALARAHCDQVVEAPRGRALQLNAGAAVARGDPLVFLHADTRLPPGCVDALGRLDARDGWGFFPVRLQGRSALLPMVATVMNLRSRLSGIATGDQGLFVSRALFDAAGGYPAQPLMEDIEICSRLRAHGRPRVLGPAMHASGRRWDRDGVLPTILLMWGLRLRYALGADAAELEKIYHAR